MNVDQSNTPPSPSSPAIGDQTPDPLEDRERPVRLSYDDLVFIASCINVNGPDQTPKEEATMMKIANAMLAARRAINAGQRNRHGSNMIVSTDTAKDARQRFRFEHDDRESSGWM
jgi:hypothetical protein